MSLIETECCVLILIKPNPHFNCQYLFKLHVIVQSSLKDSIEGMRETLRITRSQKNVLMRSPMDNQGNSENFSSHCFSLTYSYCFKFPLRVFSFFGESYSVHFFWLGVSPYYPPYCH